METTSRFLRPYPTFPKGNKMPKSGWLSSTHRFSDASVRPHAYSAGNMGHFTPFHLHRTWPFSLFGNDDKFPFSFLVRIRLFIRIYAVLSS